MRPFEVRTPEGEWPSVLSCDEIFPKELSCVKEIASLNDYITLVSPLSYRHNRDGDPYVDSSDWPLLGNDLRTSDIEFIMSTYRSFPRHYFRGEGNYNWKLLPSLSRPTIRKRLQRAYAETSRANIQADLVERIKRYAEHLVKDVELRVPPDSFLAWLTIAQHYHAPTYLLDWSLNPLVGLYFACEDAYDGEPSMDGVVWALDIPPKGLRDSPGAIVHLKSDKMWESAISKPDNLVSIAEKKTLNAINNHHDMNEPIVVVPELLTRRIDAQAGRFIYYANGSEDEDLYSYSQRPLADKAWYSMKRICIIPRDSKARIAEELITYRIHPGTMQADMEGYAKSLRYGAL